eukprot:GEMP01021787.1.p1 GENE.GEMP01021787.1~~GEMP01021787.1.p1  ORF type:complete len:352 (+),score=62.02 GEMP01021787.1:32-1087(+)
MATTTLNSTRVQWYELQPRYIGVGWRSSAPKPIRQPDADSTSVRLLEKKKSRLFRMMCKEGRIRLTNSLPPFPFNGREPLRFSLRSEATKFHANEGDTNATLWEIVLRQNGIFSLRLEMEEACLGTTYEAAFEGLYKVEEHIPTLSKHMVTEYPTSATSQGTIHLQFTLSARIFESRRTPWIPNAPILQVDEIKDGEEFKNSYRLEDLAGKNYFFRVNVSPACDPQDVHIVGPYMVPERPRPHDLDSLEQKHMFRRTPVPLDIDTFTPEYIFAEGRAPEEYCVPTLRRRREAAWAYPEVFRNHVPAIGVMRCTKLPSLRHSLAPPDSELRGPLRATKSSPGLLLHWKTRRY